MILLINPFTVFTGQEDTFLSLWDQKGHIFRRKHGYLRARLCKAHHKQPPGQTAPYTHINVAEWESDALYVEALRDPDIRKLSGAYRKVCTFNPALYTVLRDQSAIALEE